MEKRVILTDVDGVLLDWNNAFSEYMASRGLPMLPGTDHHYSLSLRHGISADEVRATVREFNTSEWMTRLQALRDAEEYVKRLHYDHGYVFHAITSMSSDPVAHTYREQNLRGVFGEGVFEKLVCLETGADKYDALLPYKDSGLLWVEDHNRNAQDGHELGLKAVLVEHDYNRNHVHPNIPFVKNWAEIYSLIVD